jgi:hypothetical protein
VINAPILPSHQSAKARPLTAASEKTILRALGALELKLTELIRDGIAAIQAQHNAALLEQTKLNATFADRERVETLERKADHLGSQILQLTRRNNEADQAHKEFEERIEELETGNYKRSIRIFTTGTGYLITAGIVTIGALLAAVFKIWIGG